MIRQTAEGLLWREATARHLQYNLGWKRVAVARWAYVETRARRMPPWPAPWATRLVQPEGKPATQPSLIGPNLYGVPPRGGKVSISVFTYVSTHRARLFPDRTACQYRGARTGRPHSGS